MSGWVRIVVVHASSFGSAINLVEVLVTLMMRLPLVISLTTVRTVTLVAKTPH